MHGGPGPVAAPVRCRRNPRGQADQPAPALPGRAPRTIEPADATPFDDEPYGPATAPPTAAVHDALNDEAGAETTHMSVVDAEGNAVALTQANSSTFGSSANISGFFLNDSGYLFRPESLEATAPTPWRTRITTISPTIVLEQVRAMGFEPTALTSGYARIYMVARVNGEWIGVAGPRHNGGVRGY